MYTGLFMPDGMPMPPIMSDGQRKQNADEVYLNNATPDIFMWSLMDIAMSVFEWKNLPEGVDERMLEWWLLRDGFVGFFYDETLMHDERGRAPEGYAVLPLMLGGEWDMYEYPRDRRAYAVNGLQYECDESNSVIVFNNYLRVPMVPILSQYALRLAEVQRSIDINVRQQRTAKVIRCSEKERLTYLNAAKEVDEGRNWVTADKSMDLSAFGVFDTSAPFVADKLQSYKSKLWNEALTFMGVENTNTDKKERLISDEVISNMGAVEAHRFTRLNARKQACDEINELFGLDVDVDFRSGVYIRTGSTGNAYVKTGGFESGDYGSEGE